MPSSGAVLSAIGLDLQIKICTFLHPSDILALRETCKTLQLATKQRIIWIDALHRVCLDNTLFLPSFPIPDMSDVELEQAATAPHRWIKLCAAFSKQHPLDSNEALCPTTTTIIRSASLVAPQLFLVPGGRYLVSFSVERIAVLDLGYTPNADCKLLASVGVKWRTPLYLVHSTSDGMGLIIVTFSRNERCSVYEIYPQSESPQLTQLAHIDFELPRNPRPYLLPDKLIWHRLHENRVCFRVWDYRLNHSISFSGDINVDEWGQTAKLIATNTRIIIVCTSEILVWAIPPLSPQPPHMSDQNSTHIPSLFRITFPNDFVRDNELYMWETTSSWYSGPEQPLYFDAVCQDLELHDFEIVFKPDLSDVSLHVMNTCQLPLFDPSENPLIELDSTYFRTDRICEDTFVLFWDVVDLNQCRIHIRSRLSHSTNVISPGGPIVLNVFLCGTEWGECPSICPASGRIVHVDRTDNQTIVVLDFLS